MEEKPNCIIESLLSLFTIDKGIVKVLLTRKKDDPYKGYWMLPNSILKNDEDLNTNLNELLDEKLGIQKAYIEQGNVYSDINRMPSKRIVAIASIGLIDPITLKLKREEREIETEWFKIDEIPKMAFDHELVVKENIEKLRNRLVNIEVLKILFPSDFTLPEVQKVFEQILDKKLDRRNFRKKFINLGLIEDTGYKNEGFNGRPAKLYRFKDKIEERVLF